MTVKHIHQSKPRPDLPSTCQTVLRQTSVLWNLFSVMYQGTFQFLAYYTCTPNVSSYTLILNKYFVFRFSETNSLSQVNPSRTPSEKTSKTLPSFAVSPERSERSVCSLSSGQDSLKTVIKEGFLFEKKVQDPDSQKNRASRMRRGIMAGPIASSSQVMNPTPHFRFTWQCISDIIQVSISVKY